MQRPVVIWDDYNRPDEEISTRTVSAHKYRCWPAVIGGVVRPGFVTVDDPLVSSFSGVLNGAWIARSNGPVLVDAGTPDVDVEVTWGPQVVDDSFAGVILRATDLDPDVPGMFTCWLAHNDRLTYFRKTTEGGIEEVSFYYGSTEPLPPAGFPLIFGAGDRMRVVSDGDNISVFKSDQVLVSVNNPAYNTGTHHGLIGQATSTTVGMQFDEFRVRYDLTPVVTVNVNPALGLTPLNVTSTVTVHDQRGHDISESYYLGINWGDDVGDVLDTVMDTPVHHKRIIVPKVYPVVGLARRAAFDLPLPVEKTIYMENGLFPNNAIISGAPDVADSKCLWRITFTPVSDRPDIAEQIAAEGTLYVRNDTPIVIVFEPRAWPEGNADYTDGWPEFPSMPPILLRADNNDTSAFTPGTRTLVSDGLVTGTTIQVDAHFHYNGPWGVNFTSYIGHDVDDLRNMLSRLTVLSRNEANPVDGTEFRSNPVSLTVRPRPVDAPLHPDQFDLNGRKRDGRVYFE